MPSFIASRWSEDDNAVFPDRLEIDDEKVLFFKGNLIDYNKSIIERSRIASVHLRSGIFFADVFIESFGGREIIARGFTKSDARRIVRKFEN